MTESWGYRDDAGELVCSALDPAETFAAEQASCRRTGPWARRGRGAARRQTARELAWSRMTGFPGQQPPVAEVLARQQL